MKTNNPIIAIGTNDDAFSFRCLETINTIRNGNRCKGQLFQMPYVTQPPDQRMIKVRSERSIILAIFDCFIRLQLFKPKTISCLIDQLRTLYFYPDIV